MKPINEQIKTARVEAGISGAEMARMMKIARSNYYSLERDGSNPTVATLEKIAQLLDWNFEITPNNPL